MFDTVGSLGLPEELTHSTKIKTLFGFPDRYLGEHIERGYQALALDEHRKDFVSVMKLVDLPIDRVHSLADLC